tara:strand:- start:3835 stop:5262 length:1428 start_codon:yes stop_codon:yes gene_type:complete
MTNYKDLRYSFPTSAITSGTFADARIAASNVNQHASTFDDNKIVNDISTLGLRVHTQENLAGSNTNSASFDVFQDATKITGLTNAARDSNEFISTVTTQNTAFNWKDAGTHGQPEMRSPNSNQGSPSTHGHPSSWTNDRVTVQTSGTGYTAGYAMFVFDLSHNFETAIWQRQDAMPDFNTGNTHNQPYQAYSGVFINSTDFPVGKNPQYNGSSIFRPAGVDTGGNSYGTYAPSHYFDSIMTNTVQTAFSGDSFSDSSHAGSGNNSTNITGNSHGTIIRHYMNTGSGRDLPYGVGADNNASTNVLTLGFLSGQGTSKLNYGQHSVTHSGSGRFHLTAGDANGNSGSRFMGLSTRHITNASFGTLTETVASATGSFEGTTITAGSSTTKMGAVITYQDNAGTNTLNTDIILKLSADNGSNYSTATLTALPDFATGIKMAKVNDLSVTAGTQLKYKLEFANQANGSKEARIRGVSLQY